ncbi:ATP synthase F1 subunit delta [Sphingobacteriales bacterium UPWRP_1]|nr:ATP synthase F1 subunit delta [Sphingobacteriales bacterium TSM_CSM]PSJ72797.1 ATP synthase F1 subunit delta [Sphingobacteriales bacterium UPWRP_1]
MSATRLAHRYAKSLLDLAIQNQQVEKIYDDMLEFDQALQSRDLLLLLKSPIIKSDKKLAVVKAVFKDHFEPITTAFINLVIRKHREFYLPEVVDEFIAQYKELKQIATATLVTPVPANDQILAKVKSIVLEQTGMKEVEITATIDQSLLGGFVLTFGDKQFDCSLANKLYNMRKSFEENKYIRQF